MVDGSSDRLRFLPVGLDFRGRSCVVVGGGDVGARKALTLASAGGSVTVVSPSVTEELAEQIAAGRIHWVEDSFREEHLARAFFVVAATNDRRLNTAVVGVATDLGVLVCDASSAERSQAIFGALLQQEELTVAVFTGGRDPALARRTRDRIASLLARENRPTAEPPGDSQPRIFGD
jgi:siroheme synthase-like protein